MELHSERLCYRPVCEEDLADLFRIYGDPATNTYNPAGPYPDLAYTETVLKRWLAQWRDDGFGCWAIMLRSAPDKTIGFGGLSVRDTGELKINNLGFRFETGVWGQGLATELSCFAIDRGFRTLSLPEISAVVRRNHLASQRVLQKSGLCYSREISDLADVPPSLLFTLTRESWLKNLHHERERLRAGGA